jgi:hypothetical protein
MPDQAQIHAAADLISVDVLALVARDNQLAEMAACEAAGDSFAAYWAGSASASIAHQYRVGAFVTVRA